MKLSFSIFFVLVLPCILAQGVFAESTTASTDGLKKAYLEAGQVMAGTYSETKAHPVPRGVEQTIYTLKDCVQFKRGSYGAIKADKTSSFGVYGVDPTLGKATKGKRYIVCLGVDYGKVLLCVPETPQALAALNDWARNGTLSKDERTRLRAKAGRILVVEKKGERCLESYPCQHSWTLGVVQVLKGPDAGKTLRIHGRYKSHNDVPSPVKAITGRGRFIVFLNAAGNADTDVLGTIPWSSAMEEELK